MPSLTHQRLVDREIKKFQKRGFLAFPQAAVGKYVFDILALDPINKQIEIVEVDYAVSTNPQKIAFAKTFATIRIYRPVSDQIIIGKTAQKIGNALGDLARLQILKILSSQKLGYTDLKNAIGIRDVGRYAYHLKELIKAELVRGIGGVYELTDLGQRTATFLDSL